MSSRAECRDCKVPPEEREGYCQMTISIDPKARFDAIKAVRRYLRRPHRPIDPALVQPLRLGGPCPYKR